MLIVDDSPQVRQELRTLLPLAGDIEIVGEAADGREAIRLAEALRPEVVLMDLEMPVLDGYEATRQIKAGCPCLPGGRADGAWLRSGPPEGQPGGVDVFLVKGDAVETPGARRFPGKRQSGYPGLNKGGGNDGKKNETSQRGYSIWTGYA